MRKCTLFFISVILCFISAISINAEEETLTITTYYPSPYGNYREMRAQRIAIGEQYIQGGTGGYCWPDESCTTTIDTNADLVVQGSVGIGTLTPNGFLQISNATTAITLGTWTDPVGFSCPAGTTWTDRDNDSFYDNGECQTGNVGIGTTAPGAPLQVHGATTFSTGAFVTRLMDTRAMAANVGGSLIFSGNDTAAGQVQNFALIAAHKDNAISGNLAAGLGFYTRAAGSGSWTEKTGASMFIDSTGNVGIGTTDPGTNKLEVQGGPIKATGGLIIETVSSQTAEDAMTKSTGQMWIRTDL